MAAITGSIFALDPPTPLNVKTPTYSKTGSHVLVDPQVPNRPAKTTWPYTTPGNTQTPKTP